jgi:hypothetical protein
MAPDFNPDKERHRDHKWIVHKAVRKPDFQTVFAGDKKMAFNNEGRFSIKDGGVADEIRSEYGREVTVTRVRNPKPSDRGHNYFFGQWPEMPWKKEQDNGAQEEKEVEEAPRLQGGTVAHC